MIGRSILARITFIHQLSAFVLIAVFTTSAVLLADRAMRKDESVFLHSAAQRAADSFDHEFHEEGSVAGAIRSFMAEEPASDIEIALYDRTGAPLGSTDGLPPGGRPAGQLPHAQSVQSRSGVTIEASTTSGARHESVARLARLLLLIALPLAGLAFVGARWVTARALRPLEEMALRAGAAQAGEGFRRLSEPVGLAEIDSLTLAFNRLLEELDDFLQSERRFTSEASHELRTPLTVLCGEIELCLESPELPPALRASHLRAAEHARAMQQLVESLLLLRRTTERPSDVRAEFEPVNLADAAREAGASVIQRYPERAADLSFDLPDEVMVNGNSMLMISAVGNLVDNALKFTQPGQAVRIGLLEQGARVSLTLDDAGPGIPDAERRFLFEPFFRGREARATTQGFGLGLPIVKRVVLAHGGDVLVEQSISGGARFVVRLPLWASRAS